MSVSLITEGLIEQAMMKRLVRNHPILRCSRIRFVGAGNAISMGRTLLVRYRDPVALIVDTKTIEPRAIAEQRGLMEWLLERAGDRDEWECVLVTPEVPVLLFQDEDVLRSLLPKPLSFEQRIVARYEPTRVLKEVFTSAGKPFPKALIQRIAKVNLAALWKLPVLQPLERFLLGGSQPQHPGNPA